MAATTISRSGIGTNDDGSGTTGTVVNVAYINLIYDNIDALFTAAGGITLNQAGGDAAIWVLESSDVAHGMTSLTTTQAYVDAKKYSATEGGVSVDGYTETNVAIALQGRVTTEDATRSTAGVGPVVVAGHLKSGTTTGAMSADRNILVIRNGNLTRFIFDTDGDSHQDVGTAWTNFDAFDDLALLNALTGIVSRPADALRTAFADLVAEHRDALVTHRIVTINDGPGEDGSVFVNWSRFHMLMIGAVRQLGRELADTRQRLLAIEGRA